MSTSQGGGIGGQRKTQLDRVDDFQQQHKPVAIPVAVLQKFREDRSTNAASMIAFWAFFSIFPLFLVLVTLLGFFLPDGAKDEVLSYVGGLFPLLDPSTVGGLSGSWLALIVGLGTALWSGTAVVRTAQDALNSVWRTSRTERLTFVTKLLRSLLVLVTIGLGLVVSTLIMGWVSGAGSGTGLPAIGQVLGYVVAIVLDVGLFVAAFWILTNRDITIRDVLPGAVLSGVTFWVLQSVASLIIARYLNNAQSTYGNFATVITILWWFYIQSIVTMLGAQLNVVLKEGLYPRELVQAADTEARHPTDSAGDSRRG